VSLQQQIDDLRTVLQWLQNETKQAVIVFGISLGATIVLQAVEHEPDKVKSAIAISPDANTSGSDSAKSHETIAPIAIRPTDRRQRECAGNVSREAVHQDVTQCVSVIPKECECQWSTEESEYFTVGSYRSRNHRAGFYVCGKHAKSV